MGFRWVTDVGFTGPDKGEGGKYLLLPPGYKGEAPPGYHIVHSPTVSLWAPWRTFLEDGSPAPGVERVKRFTKIYPLADADKPASPMKYVNLSGKPFSTIVDLYFGPNAPAGLESNWIPTMGKEPYLWLRLYGPEEAFWDKTFEMPDVELAD